MNFNKEFGSIEKAVISMREKLELLQDKIDKREEVFF